MPCFYVNGRYVYDKKCDVNPDLCPARKYVAENAPVHSMDKEAISATVFGRDIFTSNLIDKCISCDKQYE